MSGSGCTKDSDQQHRNEDHEVPGDFPGSRVPGCSSPKQQSSREEFKGSSRVSKSDKGKQRYHGHGIRHGSSHEPSRTRRKGDSELFRSSEEETRIDNTSVVEMCQEGSAIPQQSTEARKAKLHPTHLQDCKGTNSSKHKFDRDERELRKAKAYHQRHAGYRSRSKGKVDVEVTFGHQKRRARQESRPRHVAPSGHPSAVRGSDRMLTGDNKDSEVTERSMTRVRKIPGFYYDHEKKRYFKILPGHSNPEHVVTTDTIKAKEAEKLRVDLLEQNTPSGKVTSGLTSTLHILQSMRRGDLKQRKYIRHSTECRIRAMSSKPSTVYEPSTDIEIAGVSPVVRFIELDRSRTKIMVVLSSDPVSRIILGSISGEKGTKKELQLQEWQDVYVRNSTSSQISSARLINIDQQDSSFPGNLYVLFSWSGDYSNAVQLVKCPSENDPASYVGYRFESPGEIIRSCSWSANPQLPAHLCIGFSQEAEIIDILSSGRQRLDTKNKAVWSQVFAKMQPVIHLGLKHGHVSTYDLRVSWDPVHLLTRKVKQQSSIHQSGCVCSLKLLNDENYLLAGSSNGTIKLWDLRQGAVVQELCGHSNEYKPLPVNVDQTEGFVYAVGQDKHTRIWGMKNGNLLKTIALPVNVNDPPSTPSGALSLDWGGGGLPGMMIGATNKLFWYPF